MKLTNYLQLVHATGPCIAIAGAICGFAAFFVPGWEVVLGLAGACLIVCGAGMWFMLGDLTPMSKEVRRAIDAKDAQRDRSSGK